MCTYAPRHRKDERLKIPAQSLAGIIYLAKGEPYLLSDFKTTLTLFTFNLFREANRILRIGFRDGARINDLVAQCADILTEVKDELGP